MNDTLIKGENLHKAYRLSREVTVPALQGVDIEIKRGDFTAIVGPSGCGKSTLLHILGILDFPDEGYLTIDGVEVHRLKEKKAHQIRAKKIGFIFQGFNLIPTLTALENVMLAGKYAGMKLGERHSRAVTLLSEVGLGNRVKHKPMELSGGQQQRVAIARSLMNRPAIILADEPTGELDSATSKEIMEMLSRLNREQGQTFVMVTHNPEVAAMCKQVLKLRDGRNDN